MGVLPDHEIQRLSKRSDSERYVDGEEPLIDPYTDDLLQPASYDTLLATKILVPRGTSGMRQLGPIDLRSDRKTITHAEVEMNGGYALRPGQFILASTVEWVNIPSMLVGRIEGKSSLARVGIQIHSAGYLDPGFRGNVTLEVVNFSPRSVVIWPGMRIAQLSFSEMTSACERPYGSPGLGSHYQDSHGVEGTRYDENADRASLTPEAVKEFLDDARERRDG